MARVAPEQGGDVADPFHQVRAAGGADPFDELLASGTVGGVHPHLDEFMVFQGAFDFLEHAVVEARAPDDHDRFEPLCAAKQLLFLSSRKCHEGVLP